MTYSPDTPDHSTRKNSPKFRSEPAGLSRRALMATAGKVALAAPLVAVPVMVMASPAEPLAAVPYGPFGAELLALKRECEAHAHPWQIWRQGP